MPQGRYKSRTLRRIYVKTPGTRNVIHYRKRKPSKAHCAHCAVQLAGVPREFPAVLRNLPKSAKRPERPYGGTLCSACTRVVLRQKGRDAQ